MQVAPVEQWTLNTTYRERYQVFQCELIFGCESGTCFMALMEGNEGGGEEIDLTRAQAELGNLRPRAGTAPRGSAGVDDHQASSNVRVGK